MRLNQINDSNECVRVWGGGFNTHSQCCSIQLLWMHNETVPCGYWTKACALWRDDAETGMGVCKQSFQKEQLQGVQHDKITNKQYYYKTAGNSLLRSAHNENERQDATSYVLVISMFQLLMSPPSILIKKRSIQFTLSLQHIFLDNSYFPSDAVWQLSLLLCICKDKVMCHLIITRTRS